MDQLGCRLATVKSADVSGRGLAGFSLIAGSVSYTLFAGTSLCSAKLSWARETAGTLVLPRSPSSFS